MEQITDSSVSFAAWIRGIIEHMSVQVGIVQHLTPLGPIPRTPKRCRER